FPDSDLVLVPAVGQLVAALFRGSLGLQRILQLALLVGQHLAELRLALLRELRLGLTQLARLAHHVLHRDSGARRGEPARRQAGSHANQHSPGTDGTHPSSPRGCRSTGCSPWPSCRAWTTGPRARTTGAPPWASCR